MLNTQSSIELKDVTYDYVSMYKNIAKCLSVTNTEPETE